MAAKKASKKIKTLPIKALSGKRATSVRGGTIDGVEGESINDKHKDDIELIGSITRKK
jgi:hypothetical protein